MSAAAFARLNAKVVEKFGVEVEVTYTPVTGPAYAVAGVVSTGIFSRFPAAALTFFAPRSSFAAQPALNDKLIFPTDSPGVRPGTYRVSENPFEDPGGGQYLGAVFVRPA